MPTEYQMLIKASRIIIIINALQWAEIRAGRGSQGKGSELKNCTVTAKFAWSEVALAGAAALLTY